MGENSDAVKRNYTFYQLKNDSFPIGCFCFSGSRDSKKYRYVGFSQTAIIHRDGLLCRQSQPYTTLGSAACVY